MQASRSQSIWRLLEELQVKDEGEIQHLGTNNSVGFLHLQRYSHIGTVSLSHSLYCMGTCYAHTGVESGFSRLWYGVRVVQTTLQALFQSTITGIVVQGFRSSSVPVIYSRGLFGQVTQSSLVRVLTS